jgi:hypothetical protein
MIIQVKNVTALEYITEFLDISNEYRTQEDMKFGLQQVLLKHKDLVNYQIAVEEDTVLGFVLAYKLPESNVCEIIQVHTTKEAEKEKYLDKMFMRLLLWCDQHGIEDIRINNKRECNLSVIEVWGFAVHEVTYALKVTNNIEKLLLEVRDKLVKPMIENVTLPTKEVTDNVSDS